MEHVNYLLVIIAGIAAAGIGYGWYHPKVFGTQWVHLSAITPHHAARMQDPKYGAIALLASLIIAYVMDNFGIAWGVYDWLGALSLGFWCWAGFVAPVLINSVIWEAKPLRLYAINAGYWLVTCMVMALVLLY